MTPQKLNTLAAIFILIRNEAGEILLQQRAGRYLNGYYDLACSGHVDVGESILEASVRELNEELGIVANPQDLRLVHINQDYVDEPYIHFTFALDKWQGTPRICEPDKCTDLRYFAVDNLPKLCTQAVRVNERVHFSDELTYSKVTKADYEELMGGPIVNKA